MKTTMMSDMDLPIRTGPMLVAVEVDMFGHPDDGVYDESGDHWGASPEEVMIEVRLIGGYDGKQLLARQWLYGEVRSDGIWAKNTKENNALVEYVAREDTTVTSVEACVVFGGWRQKVYLGREHMPYSLTKGDSLVIAKTSLSPLITISA